MTPKTKQYDSHKHQKGFHYNNLHITLNTQVYNPAEDTFLLLEAIEPYKNDTILEIGTGCGIIALHCAQHGSNVLATDINPYALQLTKQNIIQNHDQIKGTIQLARGNLLDYIRLNTRFNTIIFNPPYLPTTKKETLPGWINYAYDGGITGTKTIETFLHQAPQHLKKKGICYFVGSSLQNQKYLNSTIQTTEMTHTLIAEQLNGDEYIQIHQLQKKKIIRR